VGSNLVIETSGSIVLAACRAEETLPMNPLYPADLFTSCLTTPITISARWFMINVSQPVCPVLLPPLCC
jgi:regulator-associated protein of mTOR